MKKPVIKVLLALSVLSSMTLSAAELSSYATQKLVSAQKMAEKGDYTKAIETLKNVSISQAYDLAYINRVLGVYSWQADEQDKAIDYLTQAVDSHQLKDDKAWSTEKMLADLLVNEHQYKKSLVHYHHLLSSKDAKQQDQLWLRVAQIHYQLEEWSQTLKAIEKYESFHLPDAKTPLTVKLGAELQLKRFKAGIKTVKRLIPLDSTNRDWWMQLVSLYLNTNQNRLALSTLELAKSSQVPLKQNDIVFLAQMYAQNGIPERAARVLSKVDGVEQDDTLIVQLASYWQNAREWTEAKESWSIAAKLHKKYLWNVAQIEIQQGAFDDSLKTLQSLEGHYPEDKLALAKARVMYKLNKVGPALKLAQRAHTLSPSKETKSWVKYLTQLKRYEKRNRDKGDGLINS